VVNFSKQTERTKKELLFPFLHAERTPLGVLSEARAMKCDDKGKNWSARKLECTTNWRESLVEEKQNRQRMRRQFAPAPMFFPS